MATLTLAHSPDPDDVFMWWPITGMIEPPSHDGAQRIEPSCVISKPELDTGRFRLVPLAADIAALNRRAIQQGDLDITALSMNCYARVATKYQLTCFGSSMGYGYGPKLVTRAPGGATPAPEPSDPPRMASSVCYADEVNDQTAGTLRLPPNSLIAIPGRETTAFLLLSMMLGDEHATTRTIEMPFDRILEATRSGDQGVTHGLLIHQSQLTFAQLGLSLVADVGEWWLKRTGLPLPLGGNALRRDLDARLGPGTTREVVRLLDASIRYAIEHRGRSLDYCMRFAPELTRPQAERYIEMYVNDLTIDAGEPGERAVQHLLDRGHHLGLCPNPGRVLMLRPEKAPA